MAGVYTENQPDFTWLMPYEEKQFVQYFMPYREIGIVKQASRDFIFNIEEDGNGKVTLKLMATSRQDVKLVLRNKLKDEAYYEKTLTMSPEEVVTESIDVKEAKLSELTFAICKAQSTRSKGMPLLTWEAEPDEIRPIPDAAEAALSPVDTKTNDQLYLTGLHLEQYRHATWSALDYYEEALRRDPNDVRCLNQAGLWYLRRGRFQKAEEYLRRAVKIWQKRNPNPYEGEPIFNLALCLKYQHRQQEAYELFWKATWNKAWADAGYFEAACISTAQGRYEEALDETERALISNARNHKARALKAALLRLLDKKEEALAWIQESYKVDRFNYGCMFEEHLLSKSDQPLEHLKKLMHGNVYNYHELALDYAQAGLWQECIGVLQLGNDVQQHPLSYYYMGWAQFSLGDPVEANAAFELAEKVTTNYCFPNRLEDVVALSLAKTMNPDGARAPYYLGCLYYDKRQYDLAIENWEMAARLNPLFPTVWRNLALARFNKQDRQQEALQYMEKAFELDTTDARMLMELDQLYRRMQKPHQLRLDHLQKYPVLIRQRDDLVLEEITLLNQLGRYEEAMQKIDGHQFHPWEGGEGKVPAQYQTARVELAKQALTQKEYERAARLLGECLEYPHHLGEGKLYGAQENDFYYFLGIAYEALGQAEKARECWEEATKGPQEPAAAMYYNDAKPDKIFYQGLALRRLGRHDEANGRFHRLVNYGKQHVFEHQVMDYFAVSLPDLLIWEDSLDRKNEIHCKYMLALGYFGLGNRQKAEQYLSEVEALDINHQGIQALRTLMEMS